MILDLICLAVIIIIIVDISGFIDSIKSGISFLITKGKIVKSDYRLMPFDCSFCMIFWAGLIYLIITENLSLLTITLVLLLSVLSGTIKEFLFTIINVLGRILYYVNKHIGI